MESAVQCLRVRLEPPEQQGAPNNSNWQNLLALRTGVEWRGGSSPLKQFLRALGAGVSLRIKPWVSDLDEGSAMARKAAVKQAERERGNGTGGRGCTSSTFDDSINAGTLSTSDARVAAGWGSGGGKCQTSRRRIFLGSRYEK